MFAKDNTVVSSRDIGTLLLRHRGQCFQRLKYPRSVALELVGNVDVGNGKGEIDQVGFASQRRFDIAYQTSPDHRPRRDIVAPRELAENFGLCEGLSRGIAIPRKASVSWGGNCRRESELFLMVFYFSGDPGSPLFFLSSSMQARHSSRASLVRIK